MGMLIARHRASQPAEAVKPRGRGKGREPAATKAVAATDKPSSED